MIYPETYNANIAHIELNGHVFQVLNEDGTDWDEAATAKSVNDFIASIEVDLPLVDAPITISNKS
jgi:hypothetical protein